MPTKAEELSTLIKNVRGCFQELKALGDKLHDDLGVTAAMRAVMEFLTEHGENTVPGIARVKNVSRQHIQLLVDALNEKGLVELHQNPAHKRSPLIALTTMGAETYSTMQKRERDVLKQFADNLSADEITSANKCLEKLNTIVRHQ